MDPGVIFSSALRLAPVQEFVHRTGSGLLAILAGMAFTVVCARGQSGAPQDGRDHWNSVAGESLPWQPLPGSESAVRDAQVQPAGFRPSAWPPHTHVPPPAFPGPADGPGASGPAIQIDMPVPPAAGDSGNGWLAGLRRLIGRETSRLNWGRMLASLGMVTGGWLLFVSLARSLQSRAGQRGSARLFEMVGSTRLNSRQSLQLVRVGSRLLVLLVSPEGAQAIGEISHPAEVESLVPAGTGQRTPGTGGGSSSCCPNCRLPPVIAGVRNDPKGEAVLRALQQALAAAPPTRDLEA